MQLLGQLTVIGDVTEEAFKSGYPAFPSLVRVNVISEECLKVVWLKFVVMLVKLFTSRVKARI